MRGSCVVGGCCAVLAAVGSLGASAGVIGVDARNGFAANTIMATGDSFETFRVVLANAGHTLVPLTSFETTDLQSLDGVIVTMPYPPTSGDTSVFYSGSEIDSLHAFVRRGGGMLVNADAGGFSDQAVGNMNALAAPYGVTYAAGASADFGFTVPPSLFSVAHPITAGITRILAGDFHRRIEVLDPPAADVFTAAADADQRFMALVDGAPGDGNVVLLTDKAMWLDPLEGDNADIEAYRLLGQNTLNDNERFLENVLMYIDGVPFPLGDVDETGCVDLGDVALLLSAFGTGSGGDINGDGVTGWMIWRCCCRTLGVGC